MKRLIVFLHEDTDEEKKRFCESNKGFIDCNEGDFRYRLEGDDVFAHVWCDNGHKEALRKVLDLSSASESIDEITPKIATAWAYIYPAIDTLLTVLGPKDVEKMLIFVHWHGTTGFEGMDHISKRFNDFLKGKFGDRWKSYAISSDMDTPQNEPIFDVKEPVIPVRNFTAWFEMYEKWLENAGKLPEDAEYVDHKKYGAEQTGAKQCGDDSERKVGESGKLPDSPSGSVASSGQVEDMFVGNGHCRTWFLWFGIWILIIGALGLITMSGFCICHLLSPVDFVIMPSWSKFCLAMGIIFSSITGGIVAALMVRMFHKRIRRKEMLYGGELNVLMKSIAKIPDNDLMRRSVGQVIEKVETLVLDSEDRS